MSTPLEANVKTAFTKIVVFMRELKEAFAVDFPELDKYYQLCKKTSMDRKDLIERQVKLFGDFCKANTEAIHAGDLTKLTTDDIAFNDKIKFNLARIVAKADSNSCKVILKYLQLIQCLLHPDDKLKEKLVHEAQEEKKSNPTDDIFTNILTRVEERYKDKDVSNFGATIADMQSSGFMEELASSVTTGLDKGEIDLTKLMQGAFGMFNKLKQEANDPQISGMLGMVESMINTCKTTMNLPQ